MDRLLDKALIHENYVQGKRITFKFLLNNYKYSLGSFLFFWVERNIFLSEKITIKVIESASKQI